MVHSHAFCQLTAQRFLTLPPIAMAHFDKDGFSPALQVTIYFFRSRFSCSFQAKSVLDAFEELNEPEDTKKSCWATSQEQRLLSGHFLLREDTQSFQMRRAKS